MSMDAFRERHVQETKGQEGDGSNKRQNAQHTTPERFGPWMVVTRDQRRRRQVVRKAGDQFREVPPTYGTVKETNTAIGSRYSILTNDEPGTKNHRIEDNSGTQGQQGQNEDGCEVSIMENIPDMTVGGGKNRGRARQGLNGSTTNACERVPPEAIRVEGTSSLSVRGITQRVKDVGLEKHKEVGPVGHVPCETSRVPNRRAGTSPFVMDLDAPSSPRFV